MSNNLAKVLGTAATWFGVAALAFALRGDPALVGNIQPMLGAGAVSTFCIWYFG